MFSDSDNLVDGAAVRIAWLEKIYRLSMFLCMLGHDKCRICLNRK